LLFALRGPAPIPCLMRHKRFSLATMPLHQALASVLQLTNRLLVSAHEQFRLASDFFPDRLTATFVALLLLLPLYPADFGYPRTRYFRESRFFLHFRPEKLCASCIGQFAGTNQ